MAEGDNDEDIMETLLSLTAVSIIVLADHQIVLSHYTQYSS